MLAPPAPANEPTRLATLYRYDILDSEPEDLFDDLAELAAQICEAPIALVSLVDHSRQWFKARVGLSVTETARSVSFCAHAILQPRVFVVPDTLEDARFADNPLVTGPPNIRFYAGAPLFTPEGYGLGTLCVIDREPRALSAAQESALKVLRTHILKLLDLRLKARELREANRELDAFSYAVSHDLRGPLRALTGFSCMLLEDHGGALDAAGRELIGRIARAARRMDRITDDLLFLSRATRSPLNVDTVDLSAMATALVEELAQADPARRVSVRIEPGLVAAGDRGLVRIALRNLLGNAWKFTAGRDPAEIEFGRDDRGGRAHFFVRDNGAGFDMAYAARLFEPFQRLHADADFEGSGIGLATVRRIVERHGGAIVAESAVGHGATFLFTLPPAGH